MQHEVLQSEVDSEMTRRKRTIVHLQHSATNTNNIMSLMHLEAFGIVLKTSSDIKTKTFPSHSIRGPKKAFGKQKQKKKKKTKQRLTPSILIKKDKDKEHISQIVQNSDVIVGYNLAVGASRRHIGTIDFCSGNRPFKHYFLHLIRIAEGLNAEIAIDNVLAIINEDIKKKIEETERSYFVLFLQFASILLSVTTRIIKGQMDYIKSKVETEADKDKSNVFDKQNWSQLWKDFRQEAGVSNKSEFLKDNCKDYINELHTSNESEQLNIKTRKVLTNPTVNNVNDVILCIQINQMLYIKANNKCNNITPDIKICQYQLNKTYNFL
ncbi:hypothetical protein RFI_02812 [Reticulomyxa filosa]|uniref:Uncharacterized protein n=1 Tax=Reticulomyxa filosa TaxID=46433 RepID=X6P9H2_RETFI|nr:hypothetical protein RFI_02812 [Reticulomyxa filosa]|eukprot:ETO34282.1 hypothetical protein RFI_02812 [Reticulomyxa filosa]